jgi:hypothetical protein
MERSLQNYPMACEVGRGLERDFSSLLGLIVPVKGGPPASTHGPL